MLDELGGCEQRFMAAFTSSSLCFYLNSSWDDVARNYVVVELHVVKTRLTRGGVGCAPLMSVGEENAHA